MPQRSTEAVHTLRHIKGGTYQLWTPEGWEGGTVVGLAPGYLERYAALQPLVATLLQRDMAVAALQHNAHRHPFRVGNQRERAVHNMVHDLDDYLGPQDHMLVGHSLGGRDILAAGEKISRSHLVKGFITVAAIGRSSAGTIRNMLTNAHKMSGDAVTAMAQPLLRRALNDDVTYQMAVNAPLVSAEGLLAATATTTDQYGRLRQAGHFITEIYYSNDAISPPPSAEEIADTVRTGGEVIVLPGTHMSPAYEPQALAATIEQLAA